MKDGAFGAMGGIETSARDYARYVAWLLSAWPARDDPETGPLKRATIREIVQGSNFIGLNAASPGADGAPCPRAIAYAMGWRSVVDCRFSFIAHTGGYPGYGSVVMLVPEAGIGIFAFSSRTYGAPSAAAYQALALLDQAGLVKDRAVPLSPGVTAGYAAAQAIWRAGDVSASRDRLAMNFLMDRTAENWKAELARLKAETGECRTDAPIAPTTAMAGDFVWTCDKGELHGSILLAPTPTPTLQELQLTVSHGSGD